MIHPPRCRRYRPIRGLIGPRRELDFALYFELAAQRQVGAIEA
jgi:hypothetical protein